MCTGAYFSQIFEIFDVAETLHPLVSSLFLHSTRMLDEHFHDQMCEIIQHCPKSRQTMLFSATMTDKVEELASVSLNRPVRLFVDRNTDTAENLQQEFVRIRSKREGDREAIVTGVY